MTALPSGLPEVVADDEELARFLTQSNHFTDACTRPHAFLPNKSDYVTSVSRHGHDPIERLWELGLVAAGQRKLYGAAILTARKVRETTLEVRSDEPPERHAVIYDWPRHAEDPELQRAQQKELAILLASAAGPPLLR